LKVGFLGPQKEEIIGKWTEVYNEEFRNLFSSKDIIWVVKSRKMNGRNMHRAQEG